MVLKILDRRSPTRMRLASTWWQTTWSTCAMFWTTYGHGVRSSFASMTTWTKLIRTPKSVGYPHTPRGGGALSYLCYKQQVFWLLFWYLFPVSHLVRPSLKFSGSTSSCSPKPLFSRRHLTSTFLWLLASHGGSLAEGVGLTFSFGERSANPFFEIVFGPNIICSFPRLSIVLVVIGISSTVYGVLYFLSNYEFLPSILPS